MPRTGEKTGKGTYQCTSCGKIVKLTEPEEAIPDCPRCDAQKWWQLS